MKHKVMIVDDHELVAQGISKFFVGLPDFNLIGTYSDPKEALAKIEMLKPDLIVTDLDMPGLNGFELVQEVRKTNDAVKFILLTMHLDRQTVKKAIKLRLDGYILKSIDSGEFIFCVQTITSGRTYFTPKAMECMIDKGSEVKNTGLKKLQLLTSRELEILSLVVQGLSTLEISEQLFISRRTTETHRKAIMNKLEVNNVAGMVRIAMQEGLID